MSSFDHTHAKVTKVTFSFSEFVSACQKFIIHQFSLEIQKILEFHDLKDTPIFNHTNPNIFQRTFNTSHHALTFWQGTGKVIPDALFSGCGI